MGWLKKQFSKLKNRVTTPPWERIKVNPYDRIMGDWTPDSGGMGTDFAAQRQAELDRLYSNQGNANLQRRLFADPAGTGGPSTRTVQGQGIFTDLNANQVWGGGENYDPASSVWNGWMSAQDAMQTPTTATTAGIGYVPTDQSQQDYQNALTMADYTDTPLTAEQQQQYSSAATPPKKTWKTEREAGNDWLGDIF